MFDKKKNVPQTVFAFKTEIYTTANDSSIRSGLLYVRDSIFKKIYDVSNSTIKYNMNIHDDL